MKKITEAFNVDDPTEDDVAFILKELDTNGDGKISRDEFQVLIEEVADLIKEEQESQKL